MKIAKQRIVAGWFACLNTSHASQSTLEGLKLCGLRQEKAFRHLDSSILIASASWVNMASLIPAHGPWANWKFVSPEESVHAAIFLPFMAASRRRDCDHFFGDALLCDSTSGGQHHTSLIFGFFWSPENISTPKDHWWAVWFWHSNFRLPQKVGKHFFTQLGHEVLKVTPVFNWGTLGFWSGSIHGSKFRILNIHTYIAMRGARTLQLQSTQLLA